MSMWGGGFIQAGAAKSAAKQQAAAMREAIAEQRRQYEANVARMTPYETFGREEGINRLRDWLTAGDQPGGGVTIDPGYDWRREQGLKGVEGSAAGAGMLKSGDTLRALENYGQGLASQEYGNAFGRRMTQGDFLKGIMSGGQNAAAQQGVYGTQSANAISDLTRGIGSAEAGGTMGAANAFSGMLSQLGNLGTKAAGAYFGGAGAPSQTPGGSNIFGGQSAMPSQLQTGVGPLGAGSDYWSQYTR